MGHSWVASGVPDDTPLEPVFARSAGREMKHLSTSSMSAARREERSLQEEARTGVKLPRTQEAVLTLLEAGARSSIMIH